jgi:hypothetical protein
MKQSLERRPRIHHPHTPEPASLPAIAGSRVSLPANPRSKPRTRSWTQSLIAVLLTALAASLATAQVHTEDPAPGTDTSLTSAQAHTEAAPPSARGTIQPFSARYQVAWHGVTAGSSTLTLNSSTDGVFTYGSHIQATGLFKLVFSNALEQISTFILRDGQVAPLSYNDNGLARDRSEEVHLNFNWDTHQVTGTASGQNLTAPFPDGVLDPMSVQVELMRQLRSGLQPTHFVLWDRDEAKEYQYTRERTEKIDTPLGSFDTVVYRSDRPGSDRATRLWLAPALDWLPVQAARSRRDSTDLSMKLVSTTLQATSATQR